MTTNERVSALVGQFTQDLSALIQQEAFERVQQALEKFSGAQFASGLVKKLRASQAKRKGQTPAHKQDRRPKGEKRTPYEIHQMTLRIMVQLKRHPSDGQTVEALAKSINVFTRELALPIQKLLSAGKIRKSGQRRLTRYFFNPR